MTPKKRFPIEKALKKYYGYDSFRPGQQKLIESLLAGRDILGIMPTGAGKSVCYQIPAIFMPGITLVVSPLISLMKDQVSALIQAGIPAAFLNSSLSAAQQRKALAFARQGRYKIIYVAPERLQAPSFIDFAQNADISMIAVDEAHCVSQWGQNFRPTYLEIAPFARSLPKRPVMAALTATATGPVRSDILKLLELKQPDVLITGFDRPNLFFDVRPSKDKFADLLSFIKQHSQESGIIYCQTRKDVEDVADRLTELGYPCSGYHAGMETERRIRVQDDFIYDRIPLIAATNAFGMGIDKSNVRFVVHYSLPSSLENYYQEAGRAGRDGEPAVCMLLFAPADLQIARFLIEKSNENAESEDQKIRELSRLNRMEEYCRTPLCLRSFILEYFGQEAPGKCDSCGNCIGGIAEEDISAKARIIFNALEQLPRNYGISMTMQYLRGQKPARLVQAGLDRLAGHGCCHSMNQDDLRRLLDGMLMDGLLMRSNDEYQVVRPTAKLRQMLQSGQPISIHMKKAVAAPKGSRSYIQKTVPAQDSGLFEALRQKRMELARSEHLPPYIIMTDKALHGMIAKMPKKLEELSEISGIGPVKAKKYGQAFLDVLQKEAKNPD